MNRQEIKNDIEGGDWKRIYSSHLTAVAWLRQRDQTGALGSALGKLYVEFTDGRMYLYFNVPYNVFYYLWRGAPSKGRYFHSHIRTTFSYQRDVQNA